MTNQLPSPAEFGMPEKFSTWRPNQSDACESILTTDKRFLLQVCPTGFGKSVTYMTAAHLNEGRAVILTSTKGLQSQLLADFGEMVTDIRGKANYTCRLNTKTTCDAGLCAFGVHCSMKEDGGCLYYDQLRKAWRAKIVITNYAYWMSQNEYSEGIGYFSLLVLDEAHASPDHVIDHTSVAFSKHSRIENTLLGLDGSLPNHYADWCGWAAERSKDIETGIEDAKLKRKEKKLIVLSRLKEKVNRIVKRMDKTWVWEDTDQSVTLSPIWPRPFTEEVLFLNIPKVLLTSATVVPKTADLLGIPEPDMQHEEYPHSFPVENRPLIHLPTVRMNHRNTKIHERIWLTKLDNIIRDRTGTKGIIHTISYARRDLVLESSKWRDYMITHDRAGTEQTVRNFKRARAPCILVSPSMATGWDFPHDECRWQVIVKLPYPDTRGAIIRARAKEDGDFTAYIVMQQLIQACGRGVRSMEDWCETFIIDNNIQWFIERYKHLTVEWFGGAYRVTPIVPKPVNKGGGNEGIH